jgi:hypothetical protein
MKTYRNLINGLGAVAMGLFLAASARAGIFTWSAPAPITTADATLNLSGTVVGAAVFATEEELVALTNGAVLDFKADGSVAAVTAGSNGTTFGAFTNTTGNANFNTVLTEFNYDGGPKTITLYNLVVGQQYSVQLFALDQRGGVSSSEVANFQDPSDGSDISANFAMGDTVYVVATFTANASTVSIQENLLNSNTGNINALVVRAIGTNVPPAITSQPQPATIYHGLTANFTVGAIGTGSLSYQWQKSGVGGSLFTNLVNGGNISGATNYSLTVSTLSSGDTGDYRVVIANSYGSVTSSPAATLTVLSGSPQFSWSAPAPITTADATLNQAGTIVGAEVFGATETVVTLTNSSTVDFKADGSVAAVTIGGFGTATGAFLADTGNADFNSVLNQFTYDGGPDTIQLYNLGVGQQYTVQLFALDDRAGAAKFNQANFQDPNDPYDISTTLAMGNNVYTIGTFTASNSTVTLQENLPINNGGNINALVVRIQGVVVAPTIVLQPQPATIDQGLMTTFTVSATGTAPLSYRWQRGVVGSGIFTNVPSSSRYFGLTGASLTISNLAVGDTADYRAVVSNTGGSTNSAAATLTVQAVTPQFVFSAPATITTANATLNQAGTIVGAEVFGPTPAIVVLTNGTSVDFRDIGATATATGGGTFTGAYSGNTSNANFNAVLNQASYEIYGNPVKTITLNNLVSGQQYAAQLIALDDRNGTGGRTVNYQDPADTNDYSYTFAMPDNSYTIATFTATGSTANLQENLFGGGGNINAIVVRQLTGLPLAPQITTPPKSTAVFSGQTAQLTVGATGTSLAYQWQSGAVGSGLFANVSNGGNVSGATTAQLTLASATTAADYRVIVSNGSGSVTSSPAATLTIRPTAATLIHRWNFNETSGTTAFDSIGSANGTLVNGTGTSVSFNGSGQLVLNNPGLETTGAGSYVALPGGLVTSLSAVTFELWYTNSGLNNGNPLISFGGPINGTTLHGTNFINFFARWAGSTTAFEIQTTAGDSGVVTLGSRQQSNAFHWDFVYDPIAGTVTAYLNGAFYASASGITIPLSTVGTSVGYIGLTAWNQVGGNTDTNLPTGSFSSQYSFNSNGNYPYLNANMDEMRIYDGVLNTNAIAATQLLGPNTLLSNTAYLSAAYSAGTMTFSWPIVNGAFSLVSSPVLGANAVWTPVSGTKSVVGSNYQMSVSTTNAAAFFRLSQ